MFHKFAISMGMILGMEPKNIVILTTCCRVTAIYIFQYIVIYFSKSWVTLVYIIVYQKQKVSWRICNGLRVALVLTSGTPKKFRENHFSETYAFPQSLWSKSPWKPCVSAPIWWNNSFSNSFDRFDKKRLLKVQLIFSMEIWPIFPHDSSPEPPPAKFLLRNSE